MKTNFTDNILLLGGIVLIFFVAREIILWYYKINERITQQHETNRLLRKLAGEPEIDSQYLSLARSKTPPTVSNKDAASAPIKTNGMYTTGND